jgi:hypothetical protein
LIAAIIVHVLDVLDGSCGRGTSFRWNKTEFKKQGLSSEEEDEEEEAMAGGKWG